MKCFFHSADLDGKCSAAIIQNINPDCEMIGITHGEPFPWHKIGLCEQVFMVDYSLEPFSDMLKLADMCVLTWIDHHQTAIDELNASGAGARIWGKRKVGLAACELTWMHLHPEKRMPISVWLLGRYDVWDHVNSDVLPFQLGMRMYEAADPRHPGSKEFWGRFLDGNTVGYDPIIAEVCEEGNIILDYQHTQDRDAAKALQRPVVFEGMRCLSFNARRANGKPFREAAKEHDAIVSYWRDRDGKWIVSLYNTDSTPAHVDLGDIAKSYGGGGHKGAAGFQCMYLPFHL